MATGTIKQGLTLKTITITEAPDADLYIRIDDKLPQGSVAVALLRGTGYLCAASTNSDAQLIKCLSSDRKTFKIAYI